MESKKDIILITGITGYIGSKIGEYFLKEFKDQY